MLHNKGSDHNEKPMHHNRGVTPALHKLEETWMQEWRQSTATTNQIKF